MNITFLIGNGFDVGIGMKSRFRDFFPVYQENSQNKPENIKRLAQEIGDDYDTWADFKRALGEYTLKFTKDTKKDFLNQIRDFEIDFIKYLKENEKTLDFGDAEEIAKVMKNALINYYSLKNLAPVSNETISNVYSVYANQVRTYNFINFNYTSTLEKCLNTVAEKIVRKRKYGANEIIDKLGEIVHVHGSCDLYPIIGLNDKKQIANEELAKDANFAKCIIKPSINELLRQSYDKNAMSIINQSKIICIYGMSLGETDKVW